MDFSKDKPLYTTKIVAEMIGVTPDRLRSYDEENLIIPSREKAGKTTRRLYSQDDVEWLKNIRILLSTYKYNVSSIRLIISLLLEIKRAKKKLPCHLESIEVLNELINNTNFEKVAMNLIKTNI